MEWKGKWIWDSGEERPTNYYLYVRKVIELPAKPIEAVASVCADSRYKLFINGQFAGRGPVKSDPRWQYYDEIDITHYLDRGKNVISALVHHLGAETFNYILGRGAFLFDARISCLDPVSGKPIDIDVVSDESWKVLPAKAWMRNVPRMSVQTGYNEVYDSNKAPNGWTEIDFDDASWEAARVIGPVGIDPWPNLVSREIPFLYEHEIYPTTVVEVGIADTTGVQLPSDNKAPIAPLMGREKKQSCPDFSAVMTDPFALCRRPNINDILSIRPFNPRGTTERRAGRIWKAKNSGKGALIVYTTGMGSHKNPYVVLDFGREVTGYPRIRISTEGKGIIDLGYSELLIDGKVDPSHGGVNYADRYIVRPGVQEWETFEKRAFRYMQIDFRRLTHPIVVESVAVNFSTYPVRWCGSFTCSDQRLSDIWRVGAYTVQLNMEEIYTDCPWRERTQWWGDVRVEALTNYYVFGDPWLVRQGIKQIGQSQQVDGRVRSFWPGLEYEVIPSFCLAWILSIWDYYLFTGDDSLPREMYPKVKKLIEWFESFRDNRGLLSEVPGWMFLEWTNLELYGTVTGFNALYYKALVDASNLAKLVEDHEAFQTYASRAEEVKKGINAYLYDAERGLYPDFWSEKHKCYSTKATQTTNGVVTAHRIPEVTLAQSVLKKTLDPDAAVTQAGTFYGYYYIMGLFENGLTLEALNYIRTKWGKMLDWGATTFWEHWQATGSLCHGWASGPTANLSAYVLGVRPVQPGFRHFVVTPNPGDIKWAKGSVPTPFGEIDIAWRKSSRRFSMTVSIPQGTSATVVLPAVDGQTEHSVTVNGSIQLPDGVSRVESDGARVSFLVSVSGRYRFDLSI